MNGEVMQLAELARKAAREAVAVLSGAFSSDPGVVSAERKDIKTKADVAAQEVILCVLASSGLPVVAEEDAGASETGDGRRWLVDPLDGTMNFVRGFPMAAVSVALWDGDRPLLGVVHDVFAGGAFRGVVGAGAWLDDTPVHVSGVSDPGQAILATGFPSGRSYDEAPLLEFVAKVRRFKKVRMLGSAALMLSQVAAGRFDAYEEEDIYLWDVAAGLALVKAAGGNFRMERGSGGHKWNVKAWNGQAALA